MNKTIAVYPGSFDPFTRGHHDVVVKACELFDLVVILVAKNINKPGLFNALERVDFIKKTLFELEGVSPSQVRVDILENENMAVRHASSIGAKALIRSMRANTEFEYELSLAFHNSVQEPGVQTIFLPPSCKHQFTSSSAAREAARLHGKLGYMVGPFVEKALREKYK